MCDYCDIKEGEFAVLIEADAKAEILGTVYENIGVLSTGIYKDADGYYSLCSKYITDDQTLATTGIDLDYCPSCGMKLTNRPRRKLGE